MKIEIDKANAARDFIRKNWPDARPAIGLVLGSGWGEVVKIFEIVGTLSFSEIPGFGKAGVEGHAGILHRARIDGKEAFVFQGRRHWYEGEGWTPVVLPSLLLKEFGASKVLLTNAAGGINQNFSCGDLMIIQDHLNLMGVHPLIGPHRAELGPRFPDMTALYEPSLREALHAAAKKSGAGVQQGVYAALTGPTYETPSEIKMLRTLGADAVGMSTAPEAIIAHAIGLRVVAMSCISNLAAGMTAANLSHAEVSETLNKSMEKIREVVAQFLPRLIAA